MKQKVTIQLQLTNILKIQVEAEYIPEVPQNYEYLGDNSELEIVGMEFLEGGLYQFTDWANEYAMMQVSKQVVLNPDSIWDFLTRLCLEKYESSI